MLRAALVVLLQLALLGLSSSTNFPLQVGQVTPLDRTLPSLRECFPASGRVHQLKEQNYQLNGGTRLVTCISSYYTGCNEGRKESPLVSTLADSYAASNKPVTFFASLKGGVNDRTCTSWAQLGGRVGANYYFIGDKDLSLSYLYFTNQHPAHVVLDHCMRVRYIFQEGEMRDGALEEALDILISEAQAAQAQGVDDCPRDHVPEPPQPTASPPPPCPAPPSPPSEVPEPPQPTLSPPPPCPPLPSSPTEGVEDAKCEPFVKLNKNITTITMDNLPDDGFSIQTGLPLLSRPRDVDFNVLTGELWVANNDTEAVTIFIDPAQLREYGTMRTAGRRTKSRLTPKVLPRGTAIVVRDRGWAHYMARISSLSFDSKGFFATCQESENDYDFHDMPNYFMGPTLYNGSDAQMIRANGSWCTGEHRNVLGDADIEEVEPCFLTHEDMLHESPNCVGIEHDPESNTVYSNVYWAIGALKEPSDPLYDGNELTVIRYDFEIPHGPGSLDHSLANVRRYHDVTLTRVPGVSSHIALDPVDDLVYFVDSGAGRIIVGEKNSGRFDRFAREDQGGQYKLWSGTEPSFEYAIYSCFNFRELATNLSTPSGIAVNNHFIFVGEYATGDIVVLDRSNGEESFRIQTGEPGIMGMTLSQDGSLWFVNGLENSINIVDVGCSEPEPTVQPIQYSFPTIDCPEPTINGLLESINHTVHDCGYLNQTSDMCMGEAYGFSRDECQGEGSFNLDMLLMTGHYCHRCLPDPCLNGGECANIWSKGFQCLCADGYFGDLCQHSTAELDERVQDDSISPSPAAEGDEKEPKPETSNGHARSFSLLAASALYHVYQFMDH